MKDWRGKRGDEVCMSDNYIRVNSRIKLKSLSSQVLFNYGDYPSSIEGETVQYPIRFGF